MTEQELVAILKENAGLKARVATLKAELKRYRKLANELMYIRDAIPVSLGIIKSRFDDGFITEADYKQQINRYAKKREEINGLLKYIE